MEKKHSLSLCMITKNEGENLRGLWQSVKHIVDEWIVVDTGSTDNTIEVAKELGAKVYEEPDRFNIALTKEHVSFFAQYGVKAEIGERVFEFGRARNFSFSKATKDFILWLDGDDLLIGSDRLIQIMNSNLEPKKQLGLHLLYKYELDRYQNPIIEHYRERVLPNNGTFKWQGRIHEIIVPTLETEYIRVLPEDCHVLHNSSGERKITSGERNTRSLLLDLFEQADNPDPRTLFFLAEGMKIAGKLDKSTELYEKYIKLSGWDEERCCAAVRLFQAHLLKGDNHKALEWAYKAIKERPDFPMGYSAVAQAYYARDEFNNAERFAKHAINTDQPETLVMVDDKFNRFIPLFVLAETYLHQGAIREALTFSKQAMKYEPLNRDLLRIRHTCEALLQENEVVKALGLVTEYLKNQGELEKAQRVLDNVPVTIEHEPRIQGIRKEIQGEMEKRSQSWISKEKRLKEGQPIDPQYQLLWNDLMKFGCKSVLLVSNEPLLAIALKKYGIDTKRVVNFEKITKDYDAVFFDHNLHVIQDRQRFFDEGMEYASKLVAVSVPNRDPNALIQATPGVVETWLDSDFSRPFNVMPLQNGVVYGAAILNAPRKTKITFFCGGEHTEPWGPMSHVQGGCGGSEEAVIYLSRELAALGHEVDVINSFPHPCIVDGVKWRHVSSLYPNEKFENLILWRLPHFLEEYPIGGAEKTFLWLHDVPQDYWFKPDRMAKIDHIFALSEYHKSLVPKNYQDKVIITSNGVDIRQFEGHKIERNSRKVIYTSSYDRGLEHLLYIWPDVLKKIPDAELHIYYGWGTFDKLRTEEKFREWKSWMLTQMRDLAGVHEHGRVDQMTLAREMCSSSVFAYPCHFEEISCISAMKAQIAGCIPLTTDYAALAETNLTELKLVGNPKEHDDTLERFKDKLISLLSSDDTMNEKRNEIAKNAKQKFAWSAVAKQWARLVK